MAKKRANAAERKAARQSAVAEATGNSEATGSSTAASDTKPAGDVRPPIPVVPNPPEQPYIPPAKQIYSSVVGALDPGELEPRPRDPRTAIRVQAIALCYYDDVLRRVGDVFDIRNEREMSKAMRRVPSNTPERVTTPNQALAMEKAQENPNQALPEPVIGNRATDGNVLG